jgi:hypothetical protein
MGTQRKWMTITGWVITAMMTALLLFSAYGKFFADDKAKAEMTSGLGYTYETVQVIGVIELVCLTLYLIPKTNVLGAVLLTGYLGGATAVHVRLMHDIHVPVIVGVLVWLALFFRDPQVRALLPIRCTNSCSAPKE